METQIKLKFSTVSFGIPFCELIFKKKVLLGAVSATGERL